MFQRSVSIDSADDNYWYFAAFTLQRYLLRKYTGQKTTLEIC